VLVIWFSWFLIGVISARKAAIYHWKDGWNHQAKTHSEELTAVIEVVAWLLFAPLLYLLVGIIWLRERGE
jgi:hypothetical protein